MMKEIEPQQLHALIEKVKAGHADSFYLVIKTYESQVFSLALKIMKDRAAAEDMAQEAFLKAFEKIHTYKGEARFSTWLYRITFNLCVNQLKKNKNHQSINTDDFVDNSQHASDSNLWEEYRDLERTRYLKMAMDLLQEEDQWILTLFYQHEQSLEEIEKISGTHKNTLKVRLHRARKRLEMKLQELLKEELKDIY